MFKRAYIVCSIIWAFIVIGLGVNHYDPCVKHPGYKSTDYPLYCDGYTFGGALVEGAFMWSLCIPVYFILNWIIKGNKK